MLKKLDLNDMNTPIQEISNYLLAKYEERFAINPRLFEKVVGSVFKEIGYYSQVTGYSNDGGIDVILGHSEGNMIGVQVKRYKRKIKVEQIRAFAGALILSGHNKGLFVITSDFQTGAEKAAKKYLSKTLPIKLINAKKFYETLKISQEFNVDIDAIKEIIQKKNLSKLFYYGWDTPNNSL